MFTILLIINFLIAILICWGITKIFDPSISGIIKRIIPEDINAGWILFMKLAIFLIGLTGGVNIFRLETILRGDSYLAINNIIMEIYRTIFDTLISITWLLLVFFISALIAYLFVKNTETKKK